jgi:hypothetical protein
VEGEESGREHGIRSSGLGKGILAMSSKIDDLCVLANVSARICARCAATVNIGDPWSLVTQCDTLADDGVTLVARLPLVLCDKCYK